MKKLKIDNIFIFLSLLFILGCCIYYGTRLIYFYKIENPKIEKNETLYETILQDKTLEKKENIIYYKGKEVYNYLEYSGRIFRILSITKDGYAKLITEENQTSLVWGYNQEYENSYIRSWLNDDDNEYRSFIQSLKNTNGIIVTNNTFSDILKDDKVIANKEVKDKAGLVSLYEYELSGGANGFLNNGKSFWTSNKDESDNIYYIYKTGKVIKDYNQIIGVRPTITINTKISNFSGQGTKNNPFKIEFDQGKKLKDKYVGEYIKLDNDVYRIIESYDDYIKVSSEVMNERTFGNSSYYSVNENIGKYINTMLINNFKYKNLILTGIFNTGKYDLTNYFDFNDSASYQEKAKIGLLNIGELFLEDDDNYFLGSRPITTKKKVYQMNKDGLILGKDIKEKSGIKLTFHLDSELLVSTGTGSKKDPYIVRE